MTDWLKKHLFSVSLSLLLFAAAGACFWRDNIIFLVIHLLIFSFIFFLISVHNLKYALAIVILLLPALPNIGGKGIIPLIRADEIILFLIFVVFVSQFVLLKKTKILLSKIDKLYLLMIGGFIVSTIFGLLILSVNFVPKDMFFLVKWIQYFILMGLIRYSIKEKKDIFFYVTIMLISFIYPILLGILQYFNLFEVRSLISHLYIDPKWNYIWGFNDYVLRMSRSSSVFRGGPNEFALFAMLATVLIFSVMLAEKKVLRKLVLALFLALSLFATFATGGRTGLLGAVLGVVLLAFMNREFKSFAIFMALGIMPVIFNPNIISRLFIIFDFTSSGLTFVDESFFFRLYDTWPRVLEGFFRSPVFGLGPNLESYIFASDSYYMKILVTGGIVGMFLYLFLIFTLLKYTRQLLKTINDREMLIYLRYYLIVVIQLLIANMTLNAMLSPRYVEMFWISTGLMLSIGYLSRANSVVNEIPNAKTVKIMGSN